MGGRPEPVRRVRRAAGAPVPADPLARPDPLRNCVQIGGEEVLDIGLVMEAFGEVVRASRVRRLDRRDELFDAAVVAEPLEQAERIADRIPPEEGGGLVSTS